MSQEEFIYPGAINNIEKILTNHSIENIFLVRGNQSYIKSGARDSLGVILGKYKVTEFYGFSVNPKLEEAKIGFELLKKSNSNLIIAVGGGSVIDTAKIIKYLAIQENPGNDTAPFIAIPTTAGTGSEATHFAVVYINGIKHSYVHEFLLPTVAIVDADLLKGQSPYQMAVSGIDAFAQGIESFWSIHSTKESIKYSEKAIKLVWENLENVIQGDRSFNKKLAEGSYNAGKAINITKTTAPHALSYGFSSRFGLPHGHAVALFLPFFIKYHRTIRPEQCNDPRGADFVKNKIRDIGQTLNIYDSNTELRISTFIKKCGLEIDFNKLNIQQDNFSAALELVSIDRLQNNPGKVNKELLESIFVYNMNL